MPIKETKKVLMIAFHYPPYGGGSGVHRTLSFSRYLPDHGWQPIILTANPKSYPTTRGGQSRGIPTNVLIERAFALDTARDLSIRGSYFNWLALPDRWVTWWFGAVSSGLRLIRKYQPKAIWSTFPIATAHLIGLTLNALTGTPWIADFRDSMTEAHYPRDHITRMIRRWIEIHTVKNCKHAVFTTPGALSMYSERYPSLAKSRWLMIPNGYDEWDFIGVEKAHAQRSSHKTHIVLVHSGLLYPSERDPSAFLTALADLRRAGKVSSSELKIVFRASGHEDYYRQQLLENGVDDIVFLEPPIPYQDALTEMFDADGLLVFQASSCNHQIPAKIYEYLRIRRPIFAMTDPKGDTASLLKSSGIDTIAPLDSEEQIREGLLKFLAAVRKGRAPTATDKAIETHTRRSRTRDLVSLLDSLDN